MCDDVCDVIFNSQNGQNSHTKRVVPPPQQQGTPGTPHAATIPLPSHYDSAQEFGITPQQTQTSHQTLIKSGGHSNSDDSTPIASAFPNHVYDSYVHKRISSHRNRNGNRPSHIALPRDQSDQNGNKSTKPRYKTEYGRLSPPPSPQSNLMNVLTHLDANALRNLVVDLNRSFKIKQAVRQFYSFHVQKEKQKGKGNDTKRPGNGTAASQNENKTTSMSTSNVTSLLASSPLCRCPKCKKDPSRMWSPVTLAMSGRDWNDEFQNLVDSISDEVTGNTFLHLCTFLTLLD